MVQNNKVLTVSYGTFSCTLEGFDDAFDTMKAIAEYFRDLAADDRYFGAEPPQPDADMLARIAEREIARQVEARRDGSGFVLRAATAIAATGHPEAAATPRPETPSVTAGEAEQDREDSTPDVVAEAAVEVETAPEPAAAAAGAVAEPADEDVAEVEAEDIRAEETAEEVAEIARQDEPVFEDVDAAIEDEPVVEDEAADETVAEAATDEPEVEDLPAEPVVDDIVPTEDSIAAKLQRIRAVVSRNQEAADQEDYSEDEHAEVLSAALPSATAAAVAAVMAGQDDDEAAADEDADAEFDMSGIIDEIEAAAAADDETAKAEPEAPEDDEISAGDDSLFGHFDENDYDKGQFDEDDYDEDELVNILDDGEDPETASGTPAAPARAHLIRIKRSQIEAAIASGELEEIDEDDEEEDSDTAAAPARPSALTPEDEADLMRELAEVEAEFAARKTRADLDDDDEDEAPAPRSSNRPRTALTDTVGKASDDLSRLMDAADEKLGDPEASARHETYSRLRAAVAATKAERSAGGTLGTHTSDQTYREDLASVVKPRRPETKDARQARPTTEPRTAPLRLVAEQRVDEQSGSAARGPVRPRRVTTQILDEERMTTSAEPKGGFAEFAAEMGATSLHDLLEAAAAYMSFVEGRSQFSRPQLMNTVRQVGTGDFNREDSLRSFGQLLREGKIEKRGGGRFAASGDIGFRPDERAAG